MKKIPPILFLLAFVLACLSCGGSPDNASNQNSSSSNDSASSSEETNPSTSSDSEQEESEPQVSDNSIPEDQANPQEDEPANENPGDEQPNDVPPVVEQNHPPALQAIDPINIEEGELLSLDIIGDDQDDDLLTYSSNNLPVGATLGIRSGLLEWYPSLDQSGTYDIDVTVSDGELSVSTVIAVTVEDVWDLIQIANNNARYDPDIDADGNVAFWWDGGIYLFNNLDELIQVSQNSHCGVSCNLDRRNAGRVSIWNGKIVWGVGSANPNLGDIYYYDGENTQHLTAGDTFAAGPMIANGVIAWEEGEPRQIFISDGTHTHAITNEAAASGYGNYQPYVSVNGKVVWERSQGYLAQGGRVGYFDGLNTFNPLACPACSGVANYGAFVQRTSNMPWIINGGPVASYVYSVAAADYEQSPDDRDHHSQNENLTWRRPRPHDPLGNWQVFFYDGNKVYRVYSTGFAGAPRTGGNRIVWRDQRTLAMYVAVKK